MAALYPAANFVFAELLSLIVHTSTTLDLLQYRLVNRHWKKVATQILLQRDSLKVTLEMDGKNRTINGDPTFGLFKRATANLCEEHQKLRSDLKGEKTFPDFLKLVINSSHPDERLVTPSLPADHFDFRFKNPELNRNQGQLVSFFQKCGPKIRTLTLDNFLDYFVGYPGMPNFILQYTPNLEILHIAEARHSDTPPVLTNSPRAKILHKPPNFALLRLKHIKIDRRPESRSPQFCVGISVPTLYILQHLLKIAPRLERISFKQLTDLKMMDVFGPSSANLVYIESLPLSDYNMSSALASTLEKLLFLMTKSRHGLNLQRLQLDSQEWHPNSRISRTGPSAVRQIMEANLDSLKSIQLSNGAALNVHKIQGLPTLPNVTDLVIIFNFSHGFGFSDLTFLRPDLFDHNFHGNLFSGLFPNLKTVEFIVDYCIEADFLVYQVPLWNDRLRGVKTLKIWWRRQIFVQLDKIIGSNYFAKLMQLCPETIRFEARWPYWQFSRILTPLWTNLTQLYSLTLNFELNKGPFVASFLDLDSALTGLSEETVTAVYHNWEQSGEWELPKEFNVSENDNLERPRVNSSLVSLENLKHLTLRFKFDADQRPRIVVSGVSATFGFDLMKNLKVLIVFDTHGSDECWDCELERGGHTDLLKLHKPLSNFPNITLCQSG